jgi:hypothetical protein
MRLDRGDAKLRRETNFVEHKERDMDNKKFLGLVGLAAVSVVVFAAVSGSNRTDAPPQGARSVQFLQAYYLHMYDNNKIIVAKPGKFREVMALREAGAPMSEALPSIACIPPNDTKVAVTNTVFGFSSIIIIDGDLKGCHGDVPTTLIQLK